MPPLQDTKLAATAQQEAEWVAALRAEHAAGEQAGDDGFAFICECFFMTAKALHLGLLKAVDEVSDGSLHWTWVELARAHSDAESAVERWVWWLSVVVAVCGGGCG